MADPSTSGNVESNRDIFAGTINTGTIHYHTHLHLDQIDARLADLAAWLKGVDGPLTVRPDHTLAVGAQVFPVARELLTAWQLLPRAVDAPPEVRRRAYAAWLVTRRPIDPPQEIAAREHYIPLEGYVDRRDMPLPLQFSEQIIRGEGPQRMIVRERLGDVTEAVDKHPAFVLLGAPGSGKSTVLRRLSLATARAYLVGAGSRLPLRVNLANYKTAQTEPLAFVNRHWLAELGEADLIARLRAGEILLLADGVNEMERLAAEGDRRRRANQWREFVAEYFADPGNPSRIILASRDQADYDQPLGLPRVEIEPLTEAQIEAFLASYLGPATESALAALHRLDLIAHARNPYQLYILAALYDPQTGDLPPNRGRLFAEYARRLIAREETVGHAHWLRGELQLAALAELGYAMQARSESTTLPTAEIKALIPTRIQQDGRTESIEPDALFDLAVRAGLLFTEPAAGEQPRYRFSHQLLQEQFAARHLLQRLSLGDDLSGLWRAPRTQRAMPPADVGEWDPLPPPPPTGWEQTTILAAGMTAQADAFLRAVLATNPALAGRCLSEGAADVSATVCAMVQQALLADLADQSLHRRTRVQAGRVLAAVGDPRFTPQRIGGVQVVLPDLVFVPGGWATLGRPFWDRQAYGDERPRHQVEVAAFYLGRYPVTNAAYRCFIEAGGYDTEAYWTLPGWQWRRGELETSGPVEEWLAIRAHYLRHPGEIEKRLKEGAMMPDAARTWQTVVKMSEEELREALRGQLSERPREQPYYWTDPAYHAPNQPVVGLTWYEAMAYCAWLQSQMVVGLKTDRLATLPAEARAGLAEGRFMARLPTEAEWEWAAGGSRQPHYPWGGKFDADKTNTLEGRILGTSPVGAYPAGAAACGGQDMSGNVWEWTHSLYQPYPYQPHDGREDPLAEGRRTLRGGAWSDVQGSARVSARINSHPDYFNFNFGMRVVVAPIISSTGGS